MTTPAEKTYQELRKYEIDSVKDYFAIFAKILSAVEVSWLLSGEIIISSLVSVDDKAIQTLVAVLRDMLYTEKRLIVIGNGGSTAIAIHALADYANAGGLRTMDLMNPASITCLANDYGYEEVFAKTIERFAKKGDVLFAISSSGRSPNILKACKTAKFRECCIVTFSGFNPKNPLRKLGNVNFYVPSNHYGFVELAHQTLLHCILDIFLKRMYEYNF